MIIIHVTSIGTFCPTDAASVLEIGRVRPPERDTNLVPELTGGAMKTDIKGSLVLAAVAILLASVPASAQTTYGCNLTGLEEVPANASPATGSCTVVLNAAQTQITVS